MRILLSTVLLYLAGCAYAQTPPLLPSAAGLWQFGQNAAWVQISLDGAAFQCRIAPDGTVYTSKGSFVATNAIHWQQIWGIDQVSLPAGALVLKGRYGTFEYRRTSQPMGAACVAAPQGANISSKQTRVPHAA